MLNIKIVLENTKAFKEKIKKNGFCIGADISLNDPQITEILSYCGFDFFWIDTEHAAMSIETLRSHISVTNCRGIFSMVRVPWNDPGRIKPVLDLGANGIIVPNVVNSHEAEKAVLACTYPPEGTRGYGARQPANWGRIAPSDYAKDAKESIFTVIQIESREGVENIDSILEVPDLDCVALGPMDLSASMGHVGQIDHPEVKKAITTVIEKTVNSDKILGYPAVVANNMKLAVEFVKRGVQWICLGQDVSFLTASADNSVSEFMRFLKK